MASLAAVALLLVPGQAAAGPGDVSARIARETMSPFCPGVTLHDCASGQANQLRTRIERWAQQGWSRDEILARLEAEYGPSIRAAPEAEGAGLLAWALPGIALVAGFAVAGWLARRWTVGRRAPDAGVGEPTASPQERRRLEAELRALRDEM